MPLSSLVSQGGLKRYWVFFLSLHLPAAPNPCRLQSCNVPSGPSTSALLCSFCQLSQAVASSRQSPFLSGRFKTQCFAGGNVTMGSCFDILSEIKPTKASCWKVELTPRKSKSQLVSVLESCLFSVVYMLPLNLNVHIKVFLTGWNLGSLCCTMNRYEDATTGVVTLMLTM